MNNQATETRVVAKEKDLSALTKSIGDLQRASQVREDKAYDLRKNAEDRVSQLERENNDIQHEIE